jgi:hypothetical protein
VLIVIGLRSVLSGQAQQEFWYQAVHQLPLAEILIDGQVDAFAGNYWWVGLPARSASIALVIHARRVSAFFASSIRYHARTRPRDQLAR